MIIRRASFVILHVDLYVHFLYRCKVMQDSLLIWKASMCVCVCVCVKVWVYVLCVCVCVCVCVFNNSTLSITIAVFNTVDATYPSFGIKYLETLLFFRKYNECYTIPNMVLSEVKTYISV